MTSSVISTHLSFAAQVLLPQISINIPALNGADWIGCGSHPPTNAVKLQEKRQFTGITLDDKRAIARWIGELFLHLTVDDPPTSNRAIEPRACAAM